MVISAPPCHDVLPFPAAAKGSSARSRRRRLVLAPDYRYGPAAAAATDAALLADAARVGTRRYS
jgi:hypothetical protein